MSHWNTSNHEIIKLTCKPKVFGSSNSSESGKMVLVASNSAVKNKIKRARSFKTMFFISNKKSKDHNGVELKPI